MIRLNPEIYSRESIRASGVAFRRGYRIRIFGAIGLLLAAAVGKGLNQPTLGIAMVFATFLMVVVLAIRSAKEFGVVYRRVKRERAEWDAKGKESTGRLHR